MWKYRKWDSCGGQNANKECLQKSWLDGYKHWLNKLVTILIHLVGIFKSFTKQLNFVKFRII